MSSKREVWVVHVRGEVFGCAPDEYGGRKMAELYADAVASPYVPAEQQTGWVRLLGQQLQRMRDGAIADARELKSSEYDDGKVFAFDVALALYSKMAPPPVDSEPTTEREEP